MIYIFRKHKNENFNYVRINYGVRITLQLIDETHAT